ncbi:alcohol dehydrogenase catalytic domain-containing protein [Embleya sp. MST-111070]|uniref:alcohol dehydrogenase catalytic domain-containing protein n=1 Tax=Embleya sp. MST-111070 TaxID=3398231 RepID=UPI003F731503
MGQNFAHVRRPGPGHIRVAIAAATVNPTDLGVAAGCFHPIGLVKQPEHTGPGWDFAGVVDAVGPGVDLAVGTRVAGSSAASAPTSSPAPPAANSRPASTPSSRWTRPPRPRGRPAVSASVRILRRMMDGGYRYLSSRERFQSLVEELASLDMGGWYVAEVEAALATLGWEVLPVEPDEIVDLARGPLPGVRWKLGYPPRGPRQGVGLVADDGLALRAVRLEVNLGTGIAYRDDHRDEVDFIRTTWDLMEEVLGTPPTLWAGAGNRWESRGPRMLWRRPGETTLAVGIDVHSAPVMYMLHTAEDSDASRRPNMSPGTWRAGDPADLPPVPDPDVPRSPVTWERVQTRLADALRALCADTPCLPARFILHLQSAHDPLRFVSMWNEGLDLRIESFVHHADLIDHELLAGRGWFDAGGLWQRRFHKAARNKEHTETAAAMLVEAIRAMGVHDPDELRYHGTVSGRGHLFRLDLPHLHLLRMDEPDE